MNHTFRFATSKFSDEQNLALWLCAQLREAAEEAEIAEPVADGESRAVWLDFAGDRYRIAVSRDTAAQGTAWRIDIEHQQPAFVRLGEGHARHRVRFDALVAGVRTIILQDTATHLIAESDD
jgi:hypothetical protein